MVIQLYINNEKLSIFKDENISVKSSITDSSDISKNMGDYSKSFTVPADDNNNRIFKHYYNATIDNTFDARVKVSGRIDLDGIPFKSGKWRLSKVSVKKGMPANYTINFFGNLVSLKDTYKKDELKNLDLTALNHSYDSDTVKLGLTNELFDGKIVYNLLVKKQYYYNSQASDHTNTPTLANIAYHSGHGGGQHHGVIWNDLYPSIQLIEIIKAIENDYGITFSRDFFGRSEFLNLYMWLNKDKETQAGGGTQQIDWDGGDNDNVNFTTNIASFTSQLEFAPTLYWVINLTITPEAGYTGIDYQLQVLNNGEEVALGDRRGVGTYEKSIVHETETTQNLTFNIISSQEFRYTAKLDQVKFVSSLPIDSFTTTASAETISSNAIISELFPKITIVDFLRGLFSMFKLVIIPINESEVYVNTIKDYYANGSLIDVTRYINFESYDVERGNIFNEINFKFSEPETILNKQFEENTSLPYGDEELQLADADGEPLDGEKLDVKLPFEQVVYERLTDIEDNEQTNVMYGAIINEDLEPTALKPHIFYNIKQSIGSKTLGFLNDNNTTSQLNSNINTPSHTINFTDRLHSCIFSSEYSNWDGNLINNTLYSDYYKDYVLSIFNIKRRNFKYKAVFPLNILSSLQLNDVLKIKEEYFRIDNYSLNLLTGESDLELINSFENDLTGLQVRNTIYYVDFQSQRVSVYIANAGLFDVKIEDSGTGWILTEVEDDIVYLKISENTGDYIRRGAITITQGDKDVEVVVIQNGIL